ncbi:hypothetical protein ACFFHJ_10110 [Planotetraspora thailandica]|uniref:hypothetical protein n=1 Tax=Planotetraspora thailandica TaxID=487172 RepID=UPI001EF1689A|nr:hypothetical protein [Planotetraspora thailandica]
MSRKLYLHTFLMGVGHHEAAWCHPRTDPRRVTAGTPERIDSAAGGFTIVPFTGLEGASEPQARHQHEGRTLRNTDGVARPARGHAVRAAHTEAAGSLAVAS